MDNLSKFSAIVMLVFASGFSAAHPIAFSAQVKQKAGQTQAKSKLAKGVTTFATRPLEVGPGIPDYDLVRYNSVVPELKRLIEDNRMWEAIEIAGPNYPHLNKSTTFLEQCLDIAILTNDIETAKLIVFQNEERLKRRGGGPLWHKMRYVYAKAGRLDLCSGQILEEAVRVEIDSMWGQRNEMPYRRDPTLAGIARTWLLLAGKAHSGGNYRMSNLYCERVVQGDPLNASARMTLGLNAYHVKNKELAKEHFRKAVAGAGEAYKVRCNDWLATVTGGREGIRWVPTASDIERMNNPPPGLL